MSCSLPSCLVTALFVSALSFVARPPRLRHACVVCCSVWRVCGRLTGVRFARFYALRAEVGSVLRPSQAMNVLQPCAVRVTSSPSGRFFVVSARAFLSCCFARPLSREPETWCWFHVFPSIAGPGWACTSFLRDWARFPLWGDSCAASQRRKSWRVLMVPSTLFERASPLPCFARQKPLVPH